MAVLLCWAGFWLSVWPFSAELSGGSSRCSLIYYIHKNLGNVKAQDKVLNFKAATAYCMDKVEASENVHKQEQDTGLGLIASGTSFPGGLCPHSAGPSIINLSVDKVY